MTAPTDCLTASTGMHSGKVAYHQTANVVEEIMKPFLEMYSTDTR